MKFWSSKLSESWLLSKRGRNWILIVLLSLECDLWLSRVVGLVPERFGCDLSHWLRNWLSQEIWVHLDKNGSKWSRLDVLRVRAGSYDDFGLVHKLWFDSDEFRTYSGCMMFVFFVPTSFWAKGYHNEQTTFVLCFDWTVRSVS